MKTIIRNAWLFTPDDRFRRGHLVIEDGVIERVDYVDDRDDSPGSPPGRGAVAGAEMIDAGGGYLLPGFVDCHFHLTTLALKELRCDLSGARSPEDVRSSLAAWAAAEAGPVVVGVDWDESGWTPPGLPTRELLDGVDSRRPVLARRVCGHVGVANTALLDRLGGVPGLIDRETGVIREHVLWEAGRLCAPPEKTLSAAIEGAIRKLHRLGVTAIHDIVEGDRFDAYLRGVEASRAPLRIDVLLHAPPDEAIRRRRDVESSRCRDLRLLGVKCFLDGSLGGMTAALNEPYRGGRGRGELLIETDRLRSTAAACLEHGLMCAMHAIGDRAVDQALDVLSGFPRDARLFRIEHCEVVGESQLARLERAPVFLALQPNFVRQWGLPGGMYENRLGAERLRTCNPFASFARRGIEFVFSSDGMPPGPLYGIPGATEHPVAAERLEPAEAIARYTRHPDRVGLQGRGAGTLEAGRAADLVLLDADPLVAQGDSFRVRMTFLGGQIVFRREAEVT